MNISAPFILRPIATTLVMAAILVGGLVGYELLPVDLSELAKAEGAVTCCSLIVQA